MNLRPGETSVALNEPISVVLWLDLVYKRIPEVVKILENLSSKSSTILNKLALQSIERLLPMSTRCILEKMMHF